MGGYCGRTSEGNALIEVLENLNNELDVAEICDVWRVTACLWRLLERMEHVGYFGWMVLHDTLHRMFQYENHCSLALALS